MVNAQGTTISVDALVTTVHSMVQYTIDENIEAMDENVKAAATAAAEELKVTGANGTAAWRGKTSISKVKNDYRSGWHAYKYKPTETTVLAVVANAHMPTLTRLLELGHAWYFFEKDKARGYINGNHAIATAYENAARILKGGVVK